jgi:gas vesicle protein
MKRFLFIGAGGTVGILLFGALPAIIVGGKLFPMNEAELARLPLPGSDFAPLMWTSCVFLVGAPVGALAGGFVGALIANRSGRKDVEGTRTPLREHDIREARVDQEAMEEGEKRKAAQAIVNMLAKKMPPKEIAAILEVDIEFVHQVLKGRTNG